LITDLFSDLNWGAIVVAALAWFGFSSVWYSVPPLSGAWQRASKVEVDESTAPSLVSLLIPTVVGYLLTTIVIALIAAGLGADSVEEGIALGVTLGVGFGVIGAAINQMYERKGRFYWLINGLNAVIAYTIVAIILAVWR
jgi:hypothetical protein